MKTNILILVVMILLGAGLTFYLDNDSVQTNVETPAKMEFVNTQKKHSAPAFSITDIKGDTYALNDFKDKAVLINFWATWCAPCVVEFPKLVTLATAHKDMTFFMISSDIDNDKINYFLTKQGTLPPNMIVARDPQQKITSGIYGTYQLPETYILDRTHHIMRKIVGDTDWNGESMNNFLQSLTQEK